jgi:hypothetical protein
MFTRRSLGVGRPFAIFRWQGQLFYGCHLGSFYFLRNFIEWEGEMHTIHLLRKNDSEANSIAIIFCFDLSSGQPIIFACLKGGSLGTTSRSFDITLFVPISALPKIGLPRFIETSQSPISQISLL